MIVVRGVMWTGGHETDPPPASLATAAVCGGEGADGRPAVLLLPRKPQGPRGGRLWLASEGGGGGEADAAAAGVRGREQWQRGADGWMDGQPPTSGVPYCRLGSLLLCGGRGKGREGERVGAKPRVRF